MRYLRLWPLVLSLGVSIGCGGPQYCNDCRAIKELQAKSGKTKAEYAKLDELRKQYNKKAKSLAAFDEMARQTPELHPDCDCPCHLHYR